MDLYSEHLHDEGNEIHHTAIIYPNVKMGKGNKIGAYCVIGSDGEIRGGKEFKGWVEIGDNNVISELVTIQRPLEPTATKIGSNNIIMAHSHIGHDAVIGNGCEISTGCIVGGYAVVEDTAKLKLGATIRNRKKIGEGATVGMCSVVVKDVTANAIVVGNPARQLK